MKHTLLCIFILLFLEKKSAKLNSAMHVKEDKLTSRRKFFNLISVEQRIKLPAITLVSLQNKSKIFSEV